MTRVVTVAARPFRAVKIDAEAMNEVFSRIYSKRGVRALGHLRKAFALTRTEAARLFGVTPEAVAKWERGGVPVLRLAEIDRCLQLARMLQRRLRPDRLPTRVRTPAPYFDGRSVLETIAESGTQPVFDHMRRMASGIPR